MKEPLADVGRVPSPSSWTFTPSGANEQHRHSNPLDQQARRDLKPSASSSGPLPLGSPIRGVCSPLRASCPGSVAQPRHAEWRSHCAGGTTPPSPATSEPAIAPGRSSNTATRGPSRSDLAACDQDPRPRSLPPAADSRGQRPAPSPGSTLSGVSPYPASPQQQASSAYSSGNGGATSSTPVMPAEVPRCLDVLLAPLLPGADEARVLERLSALRVALEEQLASGATREAQARERDAELAASKRETLTLRGRCLELQQQVSLLGGDLAGRLSLAQGSVVAELQRHLAARDAAIGESQARVTAFAADLEALAAALDTRSAAEAKERERLGAEAAQARVLCAARGRQVSELQQQVEELQARLAQFEGEQQVSSEEAAAATATLRERLSAALDDASGARQLLFEAQEERAALQQRVETLERELSDARLQVEWMEGKVSDMEAVAGRTGGAVGQQGATAALEMQLRQLQESSEAQRAALQARVERAEAQAAHLADARAEAEAGAEALRAALSEAQLAAEAAVADAAASRAMLDHERQQQRQRRRGGSAAPGASASTPGASPRPSDCGGSASGAWSDDDCAVRECHALRAELGVAHAEVASLQRRLDATAASNASQLHAAQSEIMRLQLCLEQAEEAPVGTGTVGVSNALVVAGVEDESHHNLLVAGAVGEGHAGDDEGDRDTGDTAVMWHTPLPTPRDADGAAASHMQLPYLPTAGTAGASAPSDAASDGSNSGGGWARVLDNPAFAAEDEQAAPAAAAAVSAGQEQGEPAADCGGGILTIDILQLGGGVDPKGGSFGLQGPPYYPEGSAAAAGSCGSPACAARAHELEETLSHLRRQLRQQQRALAVLQKRRGGPGALVHDSAASRAGWGDAFAAAGPQDAAAGAGTLMLAQQQQQQQQQQQKLWSYPRNKHEQQQPEALKQEAAVQTDNSGDPAAAIAARAAAAEARGAALLAAARHEIQRLQRVNEELLESRAADMTASVSLEDARHAVAEAKASARRKAAEAAARAADEWRLRVETAEHERDAAVSQVAALAERLAAAEAELQAARDAATAAAAKAVEQSARADALAARCDTLAAAAEDAEAQRRVAVEQACLDAETDAAALIMDLRSQLEDLAERCAAAEAARAAAVAAEATARADAALAAAAAAEAAEAEVMAQAGALRADVASVAVQTEGTGWCSVDSGGSGGGAGQESTPAKASAVAGHVVVGHGTSAACSPPQPTADGDQGIAAVVASWLRDSEDCTAGVPPLFCGAGAHNPAAVGAPLGVGSGRYVVGGGGGDDEMCRVSSAAGDETPSSSGRCRSACSSARKGTVVGGGAPRGAAVGTAAAGAVRGWGAMLAGSSVPVPAESSTPAVAGHARSRLPPPPREELTSSSALPMGVAGATAPAAAAPLTSLWTGRRGGTQGASDAAAATAAGTTTPAAATSAPATTAPRGGELARSVLLLAQQRQLLAATRASGSGASSALWRSAQSGSFAVPCSLGSSFAAPAPPVTGALPPSSALQTGAAPASSAPAPSQEPWSSLAAPGASEVSKPGATLPMPPAAGVSAAASATPATTMPPLGGMAPLTQDVLGALSLSRYHRERSMLQEARAAQHALAAARHEGRAAQLRDRRLAGGGGGGSGSRGSLGDGSGYIGGGGAAGAAPELTFDQSPAAAVGSMTGSAAAATPLGVSGEAPCPNGLVMDLPAGTSTGGGIGLSWPGAGAAAAEFAPRSTAPAAPSAAAALPGGGGRSGSGGAMHRYGGAR